VQQKIGTSQTVICIKFLSKNPLDIFDSEVADAVFLDSSFFDSFSKFLFLLSGQFNWLAWPWTISQAVYAFGIKAVNPIAGLPLLQADRFGRLGHGVSRNYQSYC